MRRRLVLVAVPTLVLVLGALLTSAPPARAATPIFYPDRPSFEGAMGAIIVDDYGTPPYPPGFGIYDNVTFSAFLGETDYETTGFQNWNMHQANDTYCAGCNGSFRLSFGTTSFTVGGVGVYGVAVDIMANSATLPYYAYITYGDGTTDDIALPSGPSFLGVSAPELITSIHFGLSGGGPTTGGSFVIDNLTIATQWPPVDLGDYVWYDTNQDGIQDLGESGVPSITVDLYDTGDCTGQAIATEVTDASGHYTFTGLFSGTYCLQFYDIPNGWLISPPDQGGDDSLDSDADPATGQITSIVLTTTDDLDEDVGLYVEGSAGDTVWCDADYNGLYDPGEGVPSVTVSLYEDVDCDTIPDTFLEAQDTITDGQYLFAGLPVGPSGDPVCYNVAVDAGDMGACNHPITPITYSVFLDLDTPNDLDNDFGFNVPLRLGDFVWHDTNENGIQDLDEPGVPSITVALYDNGFCTGTAVVSTTTNVAGGYSFGDLLSGTYCLQFYDIPAGWLISPPDQGDDDSIDSDADPATGQITNVVLLEDDFDEDVGLYACAPVAIEDIAVSIDLCTVTFNASLTGTAPFTYLWDFGDGATSTEMMPTHVYTASGTYTVTLTVQNCGGNYEANGSTVVTLDCVPRYYIYLPLVMRNWGGGSR